MTPRARKPKPVKEPFAPTGRIAFDPTLPDHAPPGVKLCHGCHTYRPAEDTTRNANRATVCRTCEPTAFPPQEENDQ